MKKYTEWYRLILVILIFAFVLLEPAQAGFLDFLKKTVRTGLELGLGGAKIQLVFGLYKSGKTRSRVYKKCDQVVKDAQKAQQEIENQARKDFEAGKITLRQRSAEFVRAARLEQTYRQFANTVRKINKERFNRSLIKQGAAVVIPNVTKTSRFNETANGIRATLSNVYQRVQKITDELTKGKALIAGRFDKMIGEIGNVKERVKKARQVIGELPLSGKIVNDIFVALVDTEIHLQRMQEYLGEKRGKTIDKLGINKLNSELTVVQGVIDKINSNLQESIQKAANMKPRDYEYLTKIFGNNPRVKQLGIKLNQLQQRQSKTSLDKAADEAIAKYVIGKLTEAGISEDDPHFLEIAEKILEQVSKFEFWRKRNELDIKGLIKKIREEAAPPVFVTESQVESKKAASPQTPSFISASKIPTSSPEDQGISAAPKAVISCDKCEGKVPLKVILIGAGSTGKGLTFSWNLGNGKRSNLPKVAHTYKEPKTYKVTLTVTDEQGRQDTTSVDIKAKSTEGVGVTIENLLVEPTKVNRGEEVTIKIALSVSGLPDEVSAKVNCSVKIVNEVIFQKSFELKNTTHSFEVAYRVASEAQPGKYPVAVSAQMKLPDVEEFAKVEKRLTDNKIGSFIVKDPFIGLWRGTFDDITTEKNRQEPPEPLEFRVIRMGKQFIKVLIAGDRERIFSLKGTTAHQSYKEEETDELGNILVETEETTFTFEDDHVTGKAYWSSYYTIDASGEKDMLWYGEFVVEAERVEYPEVGP